jgi:phosphoglucomutase/phosphomannomutase
VLIGDLLVGFKYHAQVLDQLERHGHFGAWRGTLQDFIIAVEESHGLLVTPEIRDKDAAGAALLLAELAALQHAKGETLLDYLDALYMRYGYYANLGTSMVMTGVEGAVQMQAIQQGLRQQPPTAVAGWEVMQHADHWDETGRHGRFLSETDRASRNVLVFGLANGARVVVRPSGTEPKNKVYIEVPTPPVGRQAGREALARCKVDTDAVAQRIADDFTRQMLALINVHLPDYALRISGLVPLDKRLDFVEQFIPGLNERAAALYHETISQEEVSDWIDAHLASYGKDARGLVREAMTAYVRTEREQAERRGGTDAFQRLQHLKTLESAFFMPAMA